MFSYTLEWETSITYLHIVKAISILGSTGSIGTQTLEIVEEFPDKFKVVALTAGRNINLLLKQIQKHEPLIVAIADDSLFEKLKAEVQNLVSCKLIKESPILLDEIKSKCIIRNIDNILDEN